MPIKQENENNKDKIHDQVPVSIEESIPLRKRHTIMAKPSTDSQPNIQSPPRTAQLSRQTSVLLKKLVTIEEREDLTTEQKIKDLLKEKSFEQIVKTTN